MGTLFNGNAWDYQAYSGVGTKIINGLNVGNASTSTFYIPLNFHLQTKVFDVVSSDTSCAVSGISTAVTLNGGTSAVTVSALTGKTFFATADNTWISF